MAIDSIAPLVTLALDAASLRHMTIAHNIANARTPGYRPQRVNFEEQMGAIRAAVASGGTVGDAALRSVQPFVETVPGSIAGGSSSSTGRLDMDVAELSQNTLHYQALLRALSRHTAIISTAINEGKR